MLDRLKRQGITIMVSTPYMDEASRCDRIALMRGGRCLSVDTPEGIRSTFDNYLYAVRSASMYKLLLDLRTYPDADSCFLSETLIISPFRGVWWTERGKRLSVTVCTPFWKPKDIRKSVLSG